MTSLASLPLEVRTQAAWYRIVAGDDPFVALHAAIWPESTVSLPGDEIVDGFCANGHPWTRENTYVRPNGFRVCRECRRTKHRRSKGGRRNRRKEPCVQCGAPATAATDKGTGGSPVPRCRKCFLATFRKSA